MNLVEQKKQFYIKYLVAIALSLFYFLFNFQYMQRFLDYDQIVYANNIKNMYRKNHITLFNPHHLHFEYTGKIFNDLIIKYFGKYGFNDMVFNLRIRSLIIGCLGIFASVILLIKITKKISLGVIGSLLIGFGHCYIVYTTKVDTGIFPSSWFVVMLWFGYELYHAKRFVYLLSIIVGFLCFIGLMFHQYLGFLCFALFVALILPKRFFDITIFKPQFEIIKKSKEKLTAIIEVSQKKRIISAVILTIVATILTIMAYLYAGKVVYNLSFDKPNPKESRGIFKTYTFTQWLFFYKYVGSEWGTGIKKFNPKASIYGVTDSFLSQREVGDKYKKIYKFEYNLKDPFNKNTISYTLIIIFFVVILFFTLFFFPELIKKYGRIFVVLIITMIIYPLFTTYWEAQYFEFWIIPYINFIIIAVLVINHLLDKITNLKQLRLIPYCFLLLMLVNISFHNIKYHLIPYCNSVITEGTALWEESYYNNLDSKSVYINPDNPYKINKK